MTDIQLTESPQAETRSKEIVRRFLKAVEMGEDPGDLSTLAD